MGPTDLATGVVDVEVKTSESLGEVVMNGLRGRFLGKELEKTENRPEIVVLEV